MEDKHELLEALQLAKHIIDYCGADSWEMQVTESARTRFEAIYEKHFPTAEPPRPYFAKWQWHCEICGRTMNKEDKDSHLNGKAHAKELRNQEDFYGDD